MRCSFHLKKHVLKFSFEAGTSRGVLREKPTWFIICSGPKDKNCQGLGEASPLEGLSEDYSEHYESDLKTLLDELSLIDLPDDISDLADFLNEHLPADKPSMRFGIETALQTYMNKDPRKVFSGPFMEGRYRMPINGLVWMGDKVFMQEQIAAKLKAGFSTIKMKVGAIDFETEFKLLEDIRKDYSAKDITLRVDANGAFDESNVRNVLERLASLEIHSIEQPIMPGQIALMAELCQEQILPIALDEELIGLHTTQERMSLLDEVMPQYIVLKPSLVGGLAVAQEWIKLAEERQIGWWMTSMLESNVGLNAIAQFTAQYKPELPQGLGTGQLYTNNIESPLVIRRGELLYDLALPWDDALLSFDFS